MKRTVLQIPMSLELKRSAESKAKSLGFSSLQELVRVMLTQITRGNDIRVDDICEKHGIGYLGLFGSMARGEARKDSDVDLLVRFDDNTNIGLFELDQVQRDLEMRFGRRVDLVTKLNKYIEPEAMKDLKTIYER
jgi:predicted nucleotidyltransferase